MGKQFPDTSIMMARGLVPGHRSVRKFGNNPSVGSTEEPIWFGSAAKTYPTTADTILVAAGGNVNDTAAGSGARTVVFDGLDADFAEISEEITLAGASASAATTQAFLRMFRAYVGTPGTYGGVNAGDIAIETSGGIVLANMPAEKAETQLGWYTVPAGYTAYIQRLDWFIPDNALIVCQMKVRESADITSGSNMRSFRTRFVANLARPGLPVEMEETPIIVPEKSDILCTGEASSGNHEVSVQMSIILVQN